ncbi:unnamed protein product [Ophioblennius macclurei]
MIIYKCVISGDEMFSDVYKISETEDGVFYEVEGKYTSRTDKIDDSLFGANASAEEVTETNEDATESGVDIVLNHKLQETGFDKKTFQAYIKGYLKSIKERNAAKFQSEQYQEAVKQRMMTVIKNMNDYQFYTGESMNPDGMVGLLNYREDGVTPFMLFLKDGLEIEKC